MDDYCFDSFLEMEYEDRTALEDYGWYVDDRDVEEEEEEEEE